MKKIKINLVGLLFLVGLGCVITSCDGKFGANGKGELRLRFSDSVYKATRAEAEIPDTNDFILTIIDSRGKTIYNGSYGDSNESIEVGSGSYTIRVVSEKFEDPGFSIPQYGDEQCVVVSSQEAINVELLCTQLNSGVKLKIDPDFLTTYPDGVLFLKSAQGRLMYSYLEKRIAYFEPGYVSLILSKDDKEETLLSRYLDAREILSLVVNVSQIEAQKEGNGLSIKVDTSRYWLDDDLVIGEENNNSADEEGSGFENALSVNQAKASVGEEDVWVSAYIVGGDLTSSNISYKAPFKSASNIAIATRSSVSSRTSCISVSLPSGDVRDALNLVSNPDLIGTHIYIKGDIVASYFGLIGIKNVSEYVIK